ncbi:MAG: hypothetical protein K0U86_08980 [Planctomycetes bacterium]|nr:hypothetical protein [Planctomycetota bacterium]MCH9725022.1 hypothetical protein [Planctomycetota bacterium]MCH9779308.1 hypothetical protein [Planctomycetota bacterium]MCH9793311.1 hypothetical protein [Planctomycetota bacterium]MDF1746403.1 hypothetical protein [Gimesia sp.]
MSFDSDNSVSSASQALANDIIQRVANLVNEAEAETKPLELDPYRSQLFELFVMANAAGFVSEEAEIDLTADNLCRELAKGWGLTAATQQAMEEQAKLPQEQVSKMRILWSVLRLWMEWDYAWKRWDEFHPHENE